LEATGRQAEAKKWRQLADNLLKEYDKKFAPNLAKGYGSYSVLWPCRLYPINTGKAHEQFKTKGKQNPSGWRYFPLATAHQGLLAGNREAGYKTLDAHLDHEQMQGWYAFDEGGKSGSGGWGRLRTTWNPNVAMPHGWAIAELWLLLRDSLLFEDNRQLILFAGIPPEWFEHPKAIQITDAPTYFGNCSVKYSYDEQKNEATINISGKAKLELTEEIFDYVVEQLLVKNDFHLAYYQPKFIVDQVVSACKYEGIPPSFNRARVADALRNLYVRMAGDFDEEELKRDAQAAPAPATAAAEAV